MNIIPTTTRNNTLDTPGRPARATGPITCRSWCWDGTGHTTTRYADDQVCFSKLPGDLMSTFDGAELSINLAAHAGCRTEVDLAVSTDTATACTKLTVHEARTFAMAILATCALVDHTGGPR